jgi:hypothetical protein
LKKKDADYYVVSEQRHNNLDINDGFIRTTCDWKRENKPISNPMIIRFIKTYNGTMYQAS